MASEIKTMQKSFYTGLCFLATVLISNQASAELESLLPSQDDGSLNLLRQLLGDLPCIWLENSCSSVGSTTLFIELLGVVTGTLFMIGGLYYAKNVFAGLMHTAQTGKFLGNWDSVSVPFWTGFSAIMIAPNPFMMGVAPIHGVVMGIVMLSIGPANIVWNAAVDYTGTGSVVVPYEVTMASNESAEIPFNILKSEVCVWTIYRQLEEAGLKPKALITTKDRTPKRTSLQAENLSKVTQRHISWGVDGFKNDICGKLTFPIKTDPGAKKFSEIESLANDVQYQNAVAINQLISDVRKIAFSIALKEQTGSEMTFKQKKVFMQSAITKYNRNLQHQITEIYKNKSGNVLTEFKEHAKQGGWIYSAGWFWRMSELQGRITNAFRLNNKTFKSRADTNIPENMATILSDNNGQITALYDSISPTSGMSAEIRRMEESGELTLLDQLNLTLGQTISGIVVSGDENPLMAIKRVGDNLKTAGAMLLGVGAGVAWIPFLGDSAQFIAPLINMLAGLLIVGGVMLGQWIPLLPYITFLFALAGWLLLIASSFLAASIWGFMHASPAGTHQAKSGYIFLLDLYLRPMLMVSGLVIGYLVFIIMNVFMSETLFKMIAISSFTSVWDAIGNVAVYVIIEMGLATLCFSYIWKVPASITNLYSGNSNVLVAPGAEQAITQTQRTAMILANMPSSGSPKSPAPKDPTPDGGSNSDSDTNRPDRYASPDFDNNELLPQAHMNVGSMPDVEGASSSPQTEMDLSTQAREAPAETNNSQNNNTTDSNQSEPQSGQSAPDDYHNEGSNSAAGYEDYQGFNNLSENPQPRDDRT